MSAPLGNKNATKNKAWQRALQRTLEGEQNADKLRKLAEKVYSEALSGNMTAVKEIGDRLDGKPVQGIESVGDGLIQVILAKEDTDAL